MAFRFLKSAEIEANRYINYIQNSSYRILTLHIDQIYIIESSKSVDTAHIYQPYYYNMWDLFGNSDEEFFFLQFKPKTNIFFNNLLKFLKIICCF